MEYSRIGPWASNSRIGPWAFAWGGAYMRGNTVTNDCERRLLKNLSKLAKHYNFPVIFSQFIEFFRVKKAYFGGFAPYIEEYLSI